MRRASESPARPEDRRLRGPRVYLLEKVIGVALAVAVVLATYVVTAAPWMSPWTADRLDDLRVTYTVQPDGSAKVREEITLRFGARSGRHGLARNILVQSPVSRTHDARWPVEKITASSPSGHDATVHTDLAMSRDGRTQMLWIRLGNSLHSIDDPTARYVLEYTQRGLVRPSVDGDVEFSINVGGPRLWADRITTRIVTPSSPKQAGCWVSLGRCDSTRVEGTTAVSETTSLNAAQELTVASRIAPGSVATNQVVFPHQASFLQRYLATWWMWLVAALALAGCGWLVGLLGAPRQEGDKRFANTAPGVVPRQATAPIIPDDHPEIPIAFSPPKLPLAEAGLLLDGRPLPRHLTATLVGLACDKAIRLIPASDRQPARMRALRDSHLNDNPSTRVFRSVFAGTKEISLDDDRMLLAFAAMADQVEATALRQKWLTKPEGRWKSYSEAAAQRLEKRSHTASVTRMDGSQTRPAVHVLIWFCASLVCLAIALGLVHELGIGAAFLPLFAPLTTLGAGQNFAVRRRPRVRTATGRALTDQVEGFRKYLMTAEAEQLRFQEGQDLYTGYLPWAVLFGCADRWTRVCQQAIGDGLLVEPDVDLGSSVQLWSGPSADLDRGLASTFADLQVDRDWTPPTPTSGPASWFSGGSGSGSGGSGGGSSFGSDGGGGSGGSGGSFGSW